MFRFKKKVVAKTDDCHLDDKVRKVFGENSYVCKEGGLVSDGETLLPLESTLTCAPYCPVSFHGVVSGSKFSEYIQGMKFSFHPVVVSSVLEGEFCVLTLCLPSFVSAGLYGFSGKPFKKPLDSAWTERKHHRSCRLWENTAGWRFSRREQVEKLINWVESCGLTSLCSKKYAIFFHDGLVRIVFADRMVGSLSQQLDCLSIFFSRM